ncbi:MAG: amidohydrolase [Thermoanaerobaculaceae bacterium]|jgi:5-methylthioadenosine/S-adenosylhomocysteine deaminase|nr:amidohydrolase [Thermoanaerobaculaceae bacterium]
MVTFLPLMLVLAQAQAPPVDLLVKGGTVVTVDAQMRVLAGGSVAVRDGKIAAVIAAGEALPAARETIDASGHLVIPGLVNTHGHVPMIVMRGIAEDLALMEWLNGVVFPAEAKTVDPELVYWGTLLAGIEMARSGTTTFSDMYYFEEEIARATEKLGLRGVLGQTIIGFPAPDHKTTDEALAATERFLQRYKDHPLVIASVAPHALYTTPLEVIVKARELARRYRAPFQIHAHESPEEDVAVRAKYGTTTLTVLEGAGVLGPGMLVHHAITVTASDIALMKRYAIGVTHNPESNMKGGSGLAPVPELLAAGIAVGLGTDGAASNNNLDQFETMDFAGKAHKLVRHDPTAMPARALVRMATIDGARALGLDDRIGSIEVGKQADLALIDLRVPELTPIYDVYAHLVYAVRGAHVRTVLVGGRVVVRDRTVTTVDAAEVMARCTAIQGRILKALGR